MLWINVICSIIVPPGTQASRPCCALSCSLRRSPLALWMPWRCPGVAVVLTSRHLHPVLWPDAPNRKWGLHRRSLRNKSLHQNYGQSKQNIGDRETFACRVPTELITICIHSTVVASSTIVHSWYKPRPFSQSDAKLKNITYHLLSVLSDDFHSKMSYKDHSESGLHSCKSDFLSQWMAYNIRCLPHRYVSTATFWGMKRSGWHIEVIKWSSRFCSLVTSETFCDVQMQNLEQHVHLGLF